MGLTQELKNLGYDVELPSDLPKLGRKYADAVPTLVKWLQLSETPREAELIVRALAVPWAREAYDTLIDNFPEVAGRSDPLWQDVAWLHGSALEVIWNDKRFEELAAIASEATYGKARQMVVLGMRKSKRAEAGIVLAPLLKDPDVVGHAAEALVKHPTETARADLETLVATGNAWHQRVARRALKKLDDQKPSPLTGGSRRQ